MEVVEKGHGRIRFDGVMRLDPGEGLLPCF